MFWIQSKSSVVNRTRGDGEGGITSARPLSISVAHVDERPGLRMERPVGSAVKVVMVIEMYEGPLVFLETPFSSW